MKDECEDLKKQADRAGDEHYREMTEYMTQPGSPVAKQRAWNVASRYRQALTWLINCYANMRDRFIARRKLATTIEMKKLVEQDIEIIEETS